ncbi:hypothetical protein D3C71_1321640 [compost metagenome]
MQLARGQQAGQQLRRVMQQGVRRAFEAAPVALAAQDMLEPRALAPDGKIAQHQVGRVGADDALQFGNAARQQLVIRIEKPQVLAIGRIDHGVARRAQAAIAGVLQQLQPTGPARRQRLHQRPGAIGGAVVQQQHLHAGVGLLHHGLDAGREIGFDVVDGNQQAQPVHAFTSCACRGSSSVANRSS